MASAHKTELRNKYTMPNDNSGGGGIFRRIVHDGTQDRELLANTLLASRIPGWTSQISTRELRARRVAAMSEMRGGRSYLAAMPKMLRVAVFQILVAYCG